MPSTIVLDCLLERNKKQNPASHQQSHQSAPKKLDITLTPQQEEAPPEPKKETPPTKAKPKIEVVSEVTDYKSMVVENTMKEGFLYYTIELDQIESFASIELDISSTQIKITSAEDK
jgi:hypothetical protein